MVQLIPAVLLPRCRLPQICVFAYALPSCENAFPVPYIRETRAPLPIRSGAIYIPTQWQSPPYTKKLFLVPLATD